MIYKKDYEYMMVDLKGIITHHEKCKGYTPYNEVARSITRAMRSCMENYGVKFDE